MVGEVNRTEAWRKDREAMISSTELLVFNGIDGATGQYLLPPLPASKVAELARWQPSDPAHLSELQWWWRRIRKSSFTFDAGIELGELDQTGWGVIFGPEVVPDVRTALEPLLEHRQKQAGGYFKEFLGPLAYRPGDTKESFLVRSKAAPGNPAEPSKVPYYLLIVGSPAAIPYRFEYQLSVQYAVGRLQFDTPEEYASYARSVIRAETDHCKRPSRVDVFSSRNPGDQSTQLTTDHLIQPLLTSLAKSLGDWEFEPHVGEVATKERLASLFDQRGGSPVLITASHGVGFPSGHSLQRAHQGALLCQEWPGPLRWSGPILRHPLLRGR